jgi:hypothetical protein
MTFRLTNFLVASSLLCGIGCSDNTLKHAPYCTDPDCIPSGSTKANTAGGADGGGDNTSVAGDGSVVTVQGQIVEVEDPSFSQSSGTVSSSTFTLRAPTTGGAVFDTTVASTFALDGVARSKAAWLTATPVSASDLWPGLVGFDSNTKTSVVLPVVRKSSLEVVSSILTTLTVVDPKKAQAVLRFIDTNGTSVAGIAVAMSGVERVAYDDGGQYTEDTKVTGSRGLAFLFNADAADTPSARLLTLSGVVSGEIGVWVVNGVATVMTIAVSTK